MRHALVVLALAVAAQAALAELQVERKEDAHVVVTGKVRAAYATPPGFYSYYVVEVLVDGLEKGTGPKVNEVVYVHCFKRNDRSDTEGASGHSYIPSTNVAPWADKNAGERVRVYLRRDEQGRLHALYPAGIEKLPAK